MTYKGRFRVWRGDAEDGELHDFTVEVNEGEVVLDVIRNATNKIAVALGADDPEVTEGVQLFTTDADGVLTTV